jgi:hypothetical protein
MQQNAANPQINVSKIPGGAGVAGAMFALFSMVIFLIGIPMLRYFLPAAIVLGAILTLAIHLARKAHPPETPGAPWVPR